jgi:tetratricopeptide (TPR) repeat protein
MGKRLGLIVGINSYQDTYLPPLQFAENDARALAQWLVNTKGGQWSPSDIQHVQGTYATHELIESLLAQVSLSIAEPDDLILIYFAGHAFVNEQGDGYLVCANTRLQELTTALHLPSLAHNLMARSRAAHILLILDCTQIGPVWSRYRTSPYDCKPLLNSTLAQLPQQQANRLFLCSCRAHEQAAEVGERGLGLFMYQCILGLCGPAFDAPLSAFSLRQLHAYLTHTLPEQQRPHLFGQEHAPLLLTGDLPAFPNAAINPSLAGTPSSYRQHVTNGSAAAPPVSSSAPLQAPAMSSVAVADQYRQQQVATLLEQAQQQLQMQQPFEALALVEQLLQVAPGDQAALILKGQLLGTVGRFQEALVIVEQLLQVDASNPLVWSMRAVLLTNLGQPQNALPAIERAIELDGSNAENYAIKNAIMSQLSMNQPGMSWVPPATQVATPSTAKSGGVRSFLLGLLVQVAGLAAGIVGSILLVLGHSSPLPGLALQSIGLALLCVNAARGAYRHGILRFALTLLTSLAAAALIGFALKPFSTRLFAALRDHPSLLMPSLFIMLWVALTAVLPLLLALGGLVVSKIRGGTPRQ